MAKKPVAKPKAPPASAIVRKKLGLPAAEDGPAPGEKPPQMRRPKKQPAVESRTEGTATGGDELADLPVDGVPLDEAVTGTSAIDDARAKMEAARAGVGNVIAGETGTAPQPAKKKGSGTKSGKKGGKGAAATTTTTTPAPKTNTTTTTPAPKTSAMDMAALAATSNPNAGQLVGPVPMDMSKLAAAATNAGQPTPAQVPTNQNVINPGKPSGLLPEPPKPTPSLLDRTLGKTMTGKAAMWAVPEIMTGAGLIGGGAGLYQLGRMMFGSGDEGVPDAIQQQAQAAQQLDFSKPLDQQMRMPNPADQQRRPEDTIRQYRQQESY